MMRPRRHRFLLLVLSLLAVGMPPAYAGGTSAVTTLAEAAPAEAQATADPEDSETDRGWIGIVTLLGAATVMVSAIGVGVGFLRRRK